MENKAYLTYEDFRYLPDGEAKLILSNMFFNRGVYVVYTAGGYPTSAWSTEYMAKRVAHDENGFFAYKLFPFVPVEDFGKCRYDNSPKLT